MRGQTQTNRTLGINAGRQRREAAGNRELISRERRAEVFRQDVEHTGNAGDPIRQKSQDKRAAKLDAAEPLILQMRAAGATYEQMREATGLSQQHVAAVLSRNGLIRRGPARLK
jgi:DNA-binding transcriptional regulator YiaG